MNRKNRSLPGTVTATLVLIGINALFWLGFVVIAALGGIPGFSAVGYERWVLSGLALGAALCLAALAFLLWRRRRFAFYLGIILLGSILILSITDQVGFWDIATMLSLLAALVLLLRDRKWYLHKQEGNADKERGER